MIVDSAAHLQFGYMACRSSGKSKALLLRQIGRRSYSSEFGTLFDVPSSQDPQQSPDRQSTRVQGISGSSAASPKATATAAKPVPGSQTKRPARPSHEERIHHLEALVHKLQEDKTKSALPRRPTRLYGSLRTYLQTAATIDDAALLPRGDFDRMIHRMEVLPAALKRLRGVNLEQGQPQQPEQVQAERKEPSKQKTSSVTKEAVELPGILSRRVPSRPASAAAKPTPTLEQVAQSPLLVDEARDEQNRQGWAEAAAFVTQQREEQGSGFNRPSLAQTTEKPNLPSPPPRLGSSADSDASHPLLTAGSFGQATRLMRQQEADMQRLQMDRRATKDK